MPPPPEQQQQPQRRHEQPQQQQSQKQQREAATAPALPEGGAGAGEAIPCKKKRRRGTKKARGSRAKKTAEEPAHEQTNPHAQEQTHIDKAPGAENEGARTERPPSLVDPTQSGLPVLPLMQRHGNQVEHEQQHETDDENARTRYPLMAPTASQAGENSHARALASVPSAHHMQHLPMAMSVGQQLRVQQQSVGPQVAQAIVTAPTAEQMQLPAEDAQRHLNELMAAVQAAREAATGTPQQLEALSAAMAAATAAAALSRRVGGDNANQSVDKKRARPPPPPPRPPPPPPPSAHAELLPLESREKATAPVTTADGAPPIARDLLSRDPRVRARATEDWRASSTPDQDADADAGAGKEAQALTSTKGPPRAPSPSLPRLLSQRKLSLVLDVDHTLLNSVTVEALEERDEGVLAETVRQMAAAEAQLEFDQRGFFKFERLGLWTKLRPYVREFLLGASKIAELHLFTMGRTQYANEVGNLLDPDGALFGVEPRRRIVGREGLAVDAEGKRSWKVFKPALTLT